MCFLRIPQVNHFLLGQHSSCIIGTMDRGTLRKYLTKLSKQDAAPVCTSSHLLCTCQVEIACGLVIGNRPALCQVPCEQAMRLVWSTENPQVALLSAPHFLSAVVDDLDVHPGRRLPHRAGAHLHPLDRIRDFWLSSDDSSEFMIRVTFPHSFTEKCTNVPARFREWLAEILRHSAILGWAAKRFESDSPKLAGFFLHNSVLLTRLQKIRFKLEILHDSSQ